MYSKKYIHLFTNRKPTSWDETRYLREEGRDGASSPRPGYTQPLLSPGMAALAPVEMEDHLQGVREGRRFKAEAESGGGRPASSPGSSAGTGGGKDT